MNISDVEPHNGGVICFATVEYSQFNEENPCGDSLISTIAVMFILDSSGGLVDSVSFDIDYSTKLDPLGITDEIASSISVNSTDDAAIFVIPHQSLSQNSTSITSGVVAIGTSISLSSTYTSEGFVADFACLDRDDEGNAWGAGHGVIRGNLGDYRLPALASFSSAGQISSANGYADNIDPGVANDFRGLSWAGERLWAVTSIYDREYILGTSSSLAGDCTGLSIPLSADDADILFDQFALTVTNGNEATSISLSSVAVSAEMINVCDDSTGCPLCIADFDRDGDTDSDDIGAFYAVWDIGGNCADADADADVDSDDVGIFFDRWNNSGC